MGALKAKVIKGLKWTTAGRGAQLIIQLIQYAILARLLTPADFGHFSMADIIIGFSMRFNDAGLSSAIIQSKEIDREKFSTLYFLSLIIGLLVFLVINISKNYIGIFFNADGVSELLFLGSFIFLILPIGKPYQTLFRKELMFDTIIKVEFVSKIIGATISILLAFEGMGAKSIIWGIITNNFVRAAYFFVRGYKYYSIITVFKLNKVKKEVNFGLNRLGASVINYFGARMDKILIGKFLGSEALGFYEIAFRLVLQPFQKIQPIISRITLPAFSKIQNNLMKMKYYYFNSIEYLNLLMVPLMIGIALTAKSALLIIFGPEWEESIPLVEVLAIVVMFKLIGAPYGNVILAIGKSQKLFYWEIYVTVFSIIMLFFAVQFNIIFVTYALLFIHIVNFIVKYFWLVKPEFKHVAHAYFIRNFLLQLAYCIPMIIVLLIINYSLELNIYYNLLVNVLVGFSSYFVVLLIFEKQKLNYILSYIK